MSSWLLTIQNLLIPMLFKGKMLCTWLLAEVETSKAKLEINFPLQIKTVVEKKWIFLCQCCIYYF